MHSAQRILGLLCGAWAGVAFGQACDTELMSGRFVSGNGQSVALDISDDGRFAILNTRATDLFDWSVDGNVFVSFLAGRDRLTGNLFAYEGNIFYPGNAVIVDPISARVTSGNVVAFDTLRDYTGNKFRGVFQGGNRVPDLNGYSDIYVRSLDIGGVSRVSVGYLGDDANGPSSNPDIEPNGDFIVYESEASNLVPVDTNGLTDIFLSFTGSPASTPFLISNGLAGAPANGASTRPRASASAGLIVFQSFATNLVSGDTNGVEDIFAVDSATYPDVERVSVSTAGQQANGASGFADVSHDGQIVCFSSVASNLVGGDTNGVRDIFVRYRRYAYTRRVSVSSDGEQGSAGSYNPGVSADGRYVIFSSNASNLVAGDTNGLPDAFVHDLWTGLTHRASLSRSGGQLNGSSTAAGVDSTGAEILFTSNGTNSGWSDFNGSADSFLRNRSCDIAPFCVADFVADGVIDTRDVIAFLRAWVERDPRADVDGNIRFDTRDFVRFLNAWADGC